MIDSKERTSVRNNCCNITISIWGSQRKHPWIRHIVKTVYTGYF